MVSGKWRAREAGGRLNRDLRFGRRVYMPQVAACTRAGVYGATHLMNLPFWSGLVWSSTMWYGMVLFNTRSQVENFTGRLQKHAVDLFSGIRIKQETPNTLDTLCSQLSSLSMRCEESILQAMDAVKAVGEVAHGDDTDELLQQQLSKIRQVSGVCASCFCGTS